MRYIKDIHKIFKELNYIMTSKHKKEVFFVFLSMLFCSVFELMGVSAIYPFLDSMMDSENLSKKWYTNIFLYINPKATNVDIIVYLSFVIIFIYIVKNAFALYCVHIQNKFSARFCREMSVLMLESYFKRPYEFFVNTNSAIILRGINGDVIATYHIMLDIMQFLQEFITATLIGIYLIYSDWFVAMAAIVLCISCFLFIVLGFKRKMKAIGKASLDADAKKGQYCWEAINGIKDIIATDRRNKFVNKFEEASVEVEKLSIENGLISACPDRILEGVCISGFIAIACIRIVMGIDPNTFIPVLGSFALGAFKILPSISKMSTRVNDVVYNRIRLTVCYENVREARSIEDYYKLNNNESDSVENKIIFNNTIKIDDVYWKYKNSPDFVLKGVNLEIKKGESIALIGMSGAGKTTLADVILGLFIPQQGKITMDGYDIKTIPHTWAKTIGYVPQTVYLTDDTIRANIAFGLPEKGIDDTKIWEALREAQLEEFVKKLPNQLDTIVGERGVKFSGGQRQRVAIARALYENPEILILDEATSALDNETENAIIESINELLGHKTMIVIAHRLTTIRNCDKIYEVKDGVAIERNKNDVISPEMIK